PRVMALLGRITERSDVKLGVLLPLMTDGAPTAAKELAGDILDGVSYAIEQFAADPIQRITVTQVNRDTERDPAVAAKAVRELAADPKVAAILGPIFSTSAVAAARAAQEQGIPLVTPTANANGIAAIGNHIFQANPDYETRGRAMAQYAILRRGFKRLAVLAPSDAYGKFLAEGFGEEVHRLGGRLIAVEWYERGASDLKKQLGAIRRAGMRAGADPQIAFGGKKKLGELMKLVGLGISVRTLDSLMNKGATVSAIKLLGPDAPEKLDSLGISVVFDDRNVDSLDYPVTSIDGIYLPISSPAEIGVISSQVVYFNFQAQLLGSGEWNNLPELDANRRYCTGVLFESETDVDTLSGRFRFWVSGFMNRFKKRPSRNTLYGFDTAELVLEELRKGATTRQGLSRALADVRDFQGIHSKIGFSPGRVNTWLPIFQFDGRNVVRVDEIQAE
ncbi:MAG: penicillin-binding protein activator, partial [Bacteroidetes bacterium]|nr:penicillin-binding protein activator [Bacteroidota bacterium]